MMRTERLAWLSVAASIALGCSANTRYDRTPEEEAGGAAGAETTGGVGTETGGASEETGGHPSGGTVAGGADAGGAGGSIGGSTSGGSTSGGSTSGGTSSGGADAGGASPGGSGGDGGAPAGGTPTGGVTNAGASGGGAETGGASTGGTETGGAGGEGGVEDMTVRGTVIDFWGQPVPNVPVDIGGTTTSTDADGEFTIAEIPDQYDATLVVQYMNGGWTNVYGWAYLGLTRRDPTLQVYTGLDQRSGDFAVSPTGATFDANRTWSIAFGGPYGAGSHEDVSEFGIGLATTTWRGPASTTETAHALFWEWDSDELPLNYLAYDSQDVVLSTSADASFTMDLSGGPLPSAALVGSVTPRSGSERENEVFVRFPSGAAIPIVIDSAGPDNFSYVVPSLSDGSISVAASEGSYGWPPYALVHADGLTATSTPDLTIPTPATPQLPAAGVTDVSVGTQFQFASSPGVGGHLVAIYDEDYYQGMFVVTDATSFTLPEIVGFVLRSDGSHYWNIESHGEFASVDAMAGPEGFLDAYSTDYGNPAGRRPGDGTFTISPSRSFVTAP